jgi:acetone carboxylase gamma subunit
LNRSGKFDFDLTVIIPVYNRLHCFLDGVESVVSQNVNCKIIVVDDGSEVTLEKMLLPYGDRVFLIRHSHNKGVSARVILEFSLQKPNMSLSLIRMICISAKKCQIP